MFVEPSTGSTKADDGGVASIQKYFVATVWLPATSVMRKSVICVPSVITAGVVSPIAQLPSSIRYSVRATPLIASDGSVEMTALDTYQFKGPAVAEIENETNSAWVSMRIVCDIVLWLPAVSVARTQNSMTTFVGSLTTRPSQMEKMTKLDDNSC